MSKGKRFGKGTGGDSSGAKKVRRKKHRNKLRTRTKNLEKGINPHTGRTFILLDKNWHYIGHYQTRYGAEQNKTPNEGMKIYERNNLLNALIKKNTFEPSSKLSQIFSKVK